MYVYAKYASRARARHMATAVATNGKDLVRVARCAAMSAMTEHHNRDGMATEVVSVDLDDPRETTCVNDLTTWLRNARKAWRTRSGAEFLGCYAKPRIDSMGVQNLREWQCGVHVCDHNALYPVTLRWSSSVGPPKCFFPEGFFHPNVLPSSGEFCCDVSRWNHLWSYTSGVSIRSEARAGVIGVVIRLLIEAIITPQASMVVNLRAGFLWTREHTGEYQRRIIAQAKQYPGP